MAGDLRRLIESIPGILFLGFLASCASFETRGRSAANYEARGDRWDLRITTDTIRLRARAGTLLFAYYGPVPARQSIPGGIRYAGDMVRTDVVAGLVEEDTMHYVVEIADRPCTDEHGRIWPSTVTFDPASADRPSGCGGPISRAPAGPRQ
jgi:hypothetical protein